MISANTRFPVIACPPEFNPYDIFSSLRTPSYTPSMVVLRPENAAMAAAKIFALESVSEKMTENKNKLKQLNKEFGV